MIITVYIVSYDMRFNMKIIGLLIYPSMCNSVQQNITMLKIKRQIFC
jgi:hypothetical protein